MIFTASFAAVAALAATALAEKRSNCPADVKAQQVRMSYHGDRGMKISWNTLSQLAAPSVGYGTTMELELGVATSEESRTYPTSSTYSNHVSLSSRRTYSYF